MDTSITLNQIVAQAKDKIYKQYGDRGTCVMGMYLHYKRRLIANQIVQGSTTNEYYFDEVKRRLVEELGYEESEFVIEWGRMD